MGKIVAALTLGWIPILALPAWAQRGPGGGGPGRGGFGPGFGPSEFTTPTIDWYPSLEAARNGDRLPADPGGDGAARLERWARRFGFEPVPKKYIFVYIRPAVEEKDPTEFNNMDLVTASRREWAFVKMDLDREHPHQKAWGVRSAPFCVTLDMKGNEILKTNSVSIDALRNLIRNTPEVIARFEAKLKIDFQRALEALKADEARGVKALIEIAQIPKVGYKEITDAQAALAEAAETAFRNCELVESVSPEQGIAYLEEIVKIYRLTPPGVRAEIRIARLEHHREAVPNAIQRLQKILKYDPRLVKKEIDEAASVLGEISREGETRIAAALTGNRAEAREALRRIGRDYAGTEAGRRALEEARKLE